MIKEDRFLISHRPYAVDLNSLDASDESRASVVAVWFRRRRGETIACIGELWDYQKPTPLTAQEFLERHTDGRYGGNIWGRWDGSGYWGDEDLDRQATYLSILRPMLENYPAIPEGFNGWWTFHGSKGSPS